ncbi:zinc-ribbon domain-containing protein [[Brevibacterium] frigoritolerans]|uniref:Zinc-ribbon domain-containing protein n=1 Tax=Peribacillus frigoritolerans TaxID=450367 RepID=A0A941FIM0_9BACI|nr:zinc-ribbon domain-containing protein [Peribacillus frigoritolerans]
MNEGVDPWQLTPKSGKKVTWQCKRDERHIWEIGINRRTHHGEVARTAQRHECYQRKALLHYSLVCSKNGTPILNEGINPGVYPLNRGKE